MSWAEELREMGSEGAPPRVEARLRSAFRERHSAGSFAWLPAAAAAVVIVTVGGGYWILRPAAPVAPPAVLRATVAPPAMAFEKARPIPIRQSAIRNPQSAIPTEVATDFFPLQYGGDPRLLGDGTLVRVKLPRAVLGNFGFPVDMDRRMERIQADVLLGGDGQAHAIRFVQPAPRLTRASY